MMPIQMTGPLCNQTSGCQIAHQHIKDVDGVSKELQEHDLPQIKQVKPSSFTGEQPPGWCKKPSQVI